MRSHFSLVQNEVHQGILHDDGDDTIASYIVEVLHVLLARASAEVANENRIIVIIIKTHCT